MTDREAGWLMWVGVWAPPAAWAFEHALGLMLGYAECGPNGRRWGIPLTTWNVLIAVAAGAIALVGIAAGLRAFLGTRDRSEAPPPGSRIHYMAAMALVIGPMFLAIILLNGLGTGLGDGCRQS